MNPWPLPTAWGQLVAVLAVALLAVLVVVGLLTLVDRRRRVPVWAARGVGVVVATWASLVLADRLLTRGWLGGGGSYSVVVDGPSARVLLAGIADHESHVRLLLVLGTVAGVLLVARAWRAGSSTATWRSRWPVEAVLVWFLTIPVQVALHSEGTTSALTWAGVVVFALGAVALLAGLLGRGRSALDRVGLLGLAWGTWLVSADAWPGVLTVVAPLLLTGLVVWSQRAGGPRSPLRVEDS